MGQAAHHYLIFETAGGFCGIAWNDAGITRFQLPTKSAEARRSCSKILPRSRSLASVLSCADSPWSPPAEVS
jgi:hypothetical protein